MNGRYGFDLLSQILLLFGCIFLLWKFTLPFGVILITVSLYRVFSRDIVCRQKEKIKFENWLRKTFNIENNKHSYYGNKDFFHRLKYNFTQYKNNIINYINSKKNYKIVKCPKCGQKLRLPRGKGKIIVTCKKCSNEFKIRT